MKFSLAARAIALIILTIIAFRWGLELKDAMPMSNAGIKSAQSVEPEPTFSRLDPSFKAPALNNNGAATVALQSDGKILIGGEFNSVDGEKRTNIIRLNPDGSVDKSFVDIGEQAPVRINSILTLDDGKILVGGYGKVIRLNQDGSYDYDFFPVTNAGDINSLKLLKNEGIIIAGSDSYNRKGPVKCIRRIHSDGAEDKSFDTGKALEFCAMINAAIIQDDNKIIIVGQFGDISASKPRKRISDGGKGNFEGTTIKGIMRLYSNGEVDTEFNASVNDTVYAVAIQKDGKILIAGDFTTVNDVPINRIVRLNTDGTIDPSFYTKMGSNRRVDILTIQNDGKVLLGGHFENINGAPRKYIARLNTNGSLDASFNIEGFFGFDDIQVQRDDKIIAVKNRSIVRLK